jgi:AraC-like DNA-binding protein
MTETPEYFADRPDGGNRAHLATSTERPSDMLSVLLRAVRLRGEQIFCCAPASPFAISFDHPGGTLHIISQGQFELQLDGEPGTNCYKRGDVVLLPAGRVHTVRHGRLVSPRALASSDVQLDTARHGEGTHWLSGTFSFHDSPAAQLLHGLPPLIELRGAGDQALVWLEVSAQMLVKETTAPSQGSLEMVSRILDLLFIQVLRAWATGPDATPGWLTGAMDPEVGTAITAIHSNPGRPWTIERLAHKSNLSRSAFAERFARRVGQPPGAYIAQVRLSNAAALLLETPEPVAAVATKIGYDSEAAFSRAFSKRYGMPPSKWRRETRTISAN